MSKNTPADALLKAVQVLPMGPEESTSLREWVSIVQVQLAKSDAEAEAVLNVVDDVRIDCEEGTDLLKSISENARAELKRLETQRTTRTKPVNAGLKLIKSWYDATGNKWKSIQRKANSRMIQAEALQREEREAALARVEAAGGSAADTIVLPAHRPPVTLPTGVGRAVIDVEVFDSGKVPREYCSPDLTILKAAAKLAHKQGQVLAVPGVRVTVRGSGT